MGQHAAVLARAIDPESEGESPFDAVLGPHRTVLPVALREQYLLGAGSPYHVILDGRMDRVWHRPRWLWPFFWLLARADILFPEVGDGIPATMCVTAERGLGNLARQHWRRTFRFPRLRRFYATMTYDNRRGRVVELLGPRGNMQVVWDVQFQPPDVIRITTEAIEVRLLRRWCRLPRWLSVEVRAVERAELACNDTIHINLEVAHPLLGSVFGYAGTFRLHRENPVEGQCRVGLPRP